MHTRARSCSAYTAMFIFVLRIALALLLIYASDEVSARDGTALGTKTVRPRANVTRDDTLPSSTALDEDVMARNLRAGGGNKLRDSSHSGRRHARTSATDRQSIRIVTSTTDVTDSSKYCSRVGDTRPDFLGNTATCTSADILTDSVRAAFLNDILPAAVEKHQSRLLVTRLTTALPIAEPSSSSPCSNFAIPTSDINSGVEDADFVIYVALPITDPYAMAWGQACATLDSDGRPSYGVAAFSPAYVSLYVNGVTLVTKTLLQALGFAPYFFQLNNMILNVTSIRGYTDTFPTINSSTVVYEAIKHFDCDTITYVQLDYNGVTQLQNLTWRGRVMHDDVMTPGSVFGYYSTITLAAMEDLGYYSANYKAADLLPWGRNAGCPFLTEKCVENNVTSYPQWFCTDPGPNMCSTDRTSVGLCLLLSYSSALPSSLQYFENQYIGGVSLTMDLCPISIGSSDQSCTNESVTSLPGSITSSTSRCFDVAGYDQLYENYPLNGICAQVQCSTDGRPSYQVKVSGAASYVDCPEGESFNLSDWSSSFTSGVISCANYSQICLQNHSVKIIVIN